MKDRDQVLVQLRMTGMDGFSADADWRSRLVGSKICPHCKWVYERVRSIDAVVHNKRRKTDLDSIGGLIAGIRVFSARFIDVVGSKLVEQVAGLGRVVDLEGFEHDRHRTAIARNESVFVRGTDPSGVGLCKECGRLLYAARGEQYILRNQIPPEPFFLSDGCVFCTNGFWKDHIYDAGLTRVEALEYPIREKPEDSLPASAKSLKAYLRSHKMFK